MPQLQVTTQGALSVVRQAGRHRVEALPLLREDIDRTEQEVEPPERGGRFYRLRGFRSRDQGQGRQDSRRVRRFGQPQDGEEAPVEQDHGRSKGSWRRSRVLFGEESGCREPEAFGREGFRIRVTHGREPFASEDRDERRFVQLEGSTDQLARTGRKGLNSIGE